MLDRYDKEIVRLLIKYKESYLTTNQIAIKISTSPLTAKRHLEKLLKEGYVTLRREGKVRKYNLQEGKKQITAQAKISWRLNYRQEKGKRKTGKKIHGSILDVKERFNKEK